MKISSLETGKAIERFTPEEKWHEREHPASFRDKHFFFPHCLYQRSLFYQ
jgi:hypothetical protein